MFEEEINPDDATELLYEQIAEIVNELEDEYEHQDGDDLPDTDSTNPNNLAQQVLRKMKSNRDYEVE